MSEDERRGTRARLPVVAADERVAPELKARLEELVDDVARDPRDRDVMRRLEWLVEHLVRLGHLSPGSAALLNRIRGDASVVRLAPAEDKHAVVSPARDCASLLHLCRARCCAMDVSVSAVDVAEGTLPWDLHRPYLLRKEPHSGYNACAGPDGRCTVYADRPARCRSYDCADDPRVWLDWDNKIPAPLRANLQPPTAAPPTGATYDH